jgi:hypothetical protein
MSTDSKMTNAQCFWYRMWAIQEVLKREEYAVERLPDGTWSTMDRFGVRGNGPFQTKAEAIRDCEEYIETVLEKELDCRLDWRGAQWRIT